MTKLDVLLGYGIAFALLATVQALSAVGFGPLGLCLSAFARSEFRAVQFMPAIVLAQLLLCGLFVSCDRMAPLLEAISDVLPLTHVYDALAPRDGGRLAGRPWRRRRRGGRGGDAPRSRPRRRDAAAADGPAA